MTPTADTDRLAAFAAATDTSPFAEAFWRTYGPQHRIDTIVAWAMAGGAQ